MAKKKKRGGTKPPKPAQQIKRLTEVQSLRVEAAQLQCALAQKNLEAIVSRLDPQDNDTLVKLEDGTWALVREAGKKAEATPGA